MLNIFPTAFIVLWMLSQASAQPLTRIGDVARQLSDQDIAEIERIVSSRGGKPWLLNGPRGQTPDLRSIEAYLPPEQSTPEVRRGKVVELLTGSASALAGFGIRSVSGSTAPGWAAMKDEAYGQVAIGGRAWDRVEGEDDVNRPFRIVGEFSDAELVGLVKFVRSSPPGPNPTVGTLRASVHGDSPIIAVVRSEGSIQVRIRKVDYSYELVTLRPQQSGWLVTAVTMVFR